MTTKLAAFRNCKWIAFMGVVLGALLAETANATTYLPSVTIGTAPLVSTNTTYYSDQGTVHTDGLAGAGTGNGLCPGTRCPPEIIEMARALKNNVDLIYDYVHNNIETVWMFGVQKGALGALIDKSGTPFDQAMLMVELLRTAGYTAGYKIGKVVFSDDVAFSAATGIHSANSACQLLSSGGIPAKVNGTSPSTCNYSPDGITAIEFSHAWVWVQINGTIYQFDPSFKPCTWKNPAPGLPALTSGAALTAATSTMTSGTKPTGVPYVQNLSAPGLAGVIQNYADSLLSFINTSLPSGELDDLIGGGTITPGYTAQSPLRQSSIANHTPSADWCTPPEHCDIPNAYRTTLRVVADKDLNPGSVHICDKTFYVDEIYGRRLTIDTDYLRPNKFYEGQETNNAYLRLDGVTLEAGATGSGTLMPRYYTNLQLTADHPYAAVSGTYMDTTLVKRVIVVRSLAIVHGWGDTNGALLAKWSEEGQDSLSPVRQYPPECGSDPCSPPVYAAPVGDFERPKAAAEWLAHFTRASRIHAQLAGSVVQVHHALGAVYSDDDVEFMFGYCTEPGCYPPHDTNVANSEMQIDIDAGISLSSKTTDGTSVARRRAALHAIAATGAALEGSIAQQLTDLVDAASTATRFEWGNSPAAAPNSNAGDPSGAGPRNFLQFDASNWGSAAGLLRFEGVGTPPADQCFVRNTPGDGHPAQYASRFEEQVQSGIESYAKPVSEGGGGFTVVASEESFLGPGERGGYYWTIPQEDPPEYECAATRQRGGAFVATLYDTNGDPIQIAHIVSGYDANSKGGGGGVPPDQQQKYDPKQAADVLRARFVDRSSVMGVNLSNGSMSYTSPASLTVGNGGFPFELSASQTWRGGQITPFGPAMPSQPQPGWTTNWHNSLVVSSSGMEAMGQSDVRAAIGTIAAFMVEQDIYKAAVTPQREVAAVLANAWWVRQIAGNVVTVSMGTSSRQFLRVSTWGATPAWISPGASPYATVAQTGDRVAYEEHCPTAPPPQFYTLSRGWDASGMAFSITNANGDVQNFGAWTNYYGDTDLTDCGRASGFRLNTWTFPYGMTVSVAYGNPMAIGNPNGGVDRITSVSNNVGRSISFAYDAGGPYGNHSMPTTISDGASSSREVTIISVLGPDGPMVTGQSDPTSALTQFTYTDDVARSATQRPVPYQQLWRVFTAEQPTLPNLEYTYDTLGRVMEARDAVALQVGGRDPYQFLIADGTRGERIDPLGQSYAVDYDVRGNAARYSDEMAHITLAAFDGRHRVTGYTYPEGDQEVFQYDSHNNTTELRRIAKPGCTVPPEPTGGCTDIVVSATWDQTWNKPLTVVNARGYTTTLTYFNSGNGKGLIQKAELQAAAAGGVKPTYSFTYDSLGKVLTASTPIGITGNESIVTTNTYDATYRNLLASTYDSGASPHIAALTTYAYDATASQDVTRITDPRGNVTEATYDLDRRKLLTMAHNGGAGAALLAETRTTYDAVGRVTKEEAAKCFDTASPCLSSGTTVATWIATRTITYTPTGKPATVKDADNRTTTTHYDNLDRVLTVTDPVSRQTHFVYCVLADANCAANAVRKEQRAYGSALQQDYATYTYTLNGKQASVKDADGNNHRTDFTYDSFDRLIRTVFPGPGTPPEENLIYYKTDGTLCSANGSPCQRITRAGDTITYTYDRLDRMTSKVVPGTGGRTATWSYDLAGQAIRLSVPLGFLERQTTLAADDYDALVASNRERHCGTLADIPNHAPPSAPVAAHPPPSAPKSAGSGTRAADARIKGGSVSCTRNSTSSSAVLRAAQKGISSGGGRI